MPYCSILVADFSSLRLDLQSGICICNLWCKKVVLAQIFLRSLWFTVPVIILSMFHMSMSSGVGAVPHLRVQYQVAESPRYDNSYIASSVKTVRNLSGGLLICYNQHVYDYHFCIVGIR